MDLACSMQGIKNKQNKHIVLGGDFNLPHINWKKKSIKARSNQHIQHQQLLDKEQELGFEHMQLYLVGKATHLICIMLPIQVLLNPATLFQAYLTTW